MSWIITKIIASSAFGDVHGQIICLADHYYLEFGLGDGDDGCQTSVLRLSHCWTGHIAVAAVLALCLRTTLLNHIELSCCIDAQTKMETMPGNVSQQQPVQATS